MNNLLSRHSSKIVILLLIIELFLGFFSLYNDSGTTDEVAHIPAGYAYLKFRDYRLNPEHPPLIKAYAALPLLFADLKFPLDLPAYRDEINGQWETGWKFIYHSDNNPDLILTLSRLPVLLLSLLLGFFVYSWTAKTLNKKTGLVALFFYVFSPNILAHSRLVTTDLGFAATFFITIYFFHQFLKRPSWKSLVLTGVFFGLAQLSKFSNLILIPYLALLLLSFSVFSKERFDFPFFSPLKKEWLRRLSFFVFSLIFIFVLGFVLVGMGYHLVSLHTPKEIFHAGIDQLLPGDYDLASIKNFLHALAKNPILRPYSWYLLGLEMVSLHLKYGHTTYFLGKVGHEGWWYYYPLSFLLKTPIPVLIMLFVSLILFFKDQIIKRTKSRNFRTYYQSLKAWLNENFFEFICWLAIITFFVVGLRSKLNIGLRHILPLYPFLHILAARYFVRIFSGALSKKNVLKASLAVFLLTWYLATNLFTFPHYLAYFNESIGGYKRGYKYSVDSNLDWGQDLKRLAFWVRENKIKYLTIDYFGGSVPEHYLGDKVLRWHSEQGIPPSGYFAVSATYYQNSRYYKIKRGQKDYSWLDDQKPMANIGGSILVYKIK